MSSKWSVMFGETIIKLMGQAANSDGCISLREVLLILCCNHAKDKSQFRNIRKFRKAVRKNRNSKAEFRNDARVYKYTRAVFLKLLSASCSKGRAGQSTIRAARPRPGHYACFPPGHRRPIADKSPPEERTAFTEESTGLNEVGWFRVVGV